MATSFVDSAYKQVHQESQTPFSVYTRTHFESPPTMNKSVDKADRDMKNRPESTKHYLLASDFDQTLSFNDSGIVLSELLGNSRFGEKVAGRSNMNLVQQGWDRDYLLWHDHDYRRVCKKDLDEQCERIRL